MDTPVSLAIFYYEIFYRQKMYFFLLFSQVKKELIESTLPPPPIKYKGKKPSRVRFKEQCLYTVIMFALYFAYLCKGSLAVT